MIKENKGKYNLIYSDADYDKIDAISNSMLSLLKRSEELFYHTYILRNMNTQSTAQMIGEANHCYLLEPEKFKENYIIGAETKHQYQTNFVDIITTDYIGWKELNTENQQFSQFYTDFDAYLENQFKDTTYMTAVAEMSGYAKSSAGTKWKELIKDEGIMSAIRTKIKCLDKGICQKSLSKSEYDGIISVCEELKKHPMPFFTIDEFWIKGGHMSIGDCINASIQANMIERSFVMEVEHLGEYYRIKSKTDHLYYQAAFEDLLPEMVIINDFKFVQSVDDIERKLIYDYGYHRQAAVYEKQLENVLEPGTIIKVLFTVVEKSYPFRVRYFLMSRETLDKGWNEILELLEIYTDCMSTQDFSEKKKFNII